MKTKTYTVYTFAELSAKAKDTAIQESAAVFGFHAADEYLESLQKLAEHFGGKLADYSVDWFACSHSSARFDMPELMGDDVASRLEKLGTFNAATLRGNGDCVLTGCGTDEDAIDGFRRAYIADGERDLTLLMQAAFRSWLKAAQAGCADLYSIETFADHCAENEYEFTADGKIAPRNL